MPLKKKLLKISKGQIAPELVERTDIGILDDSGQEITNFYDSKYGALKTSRGSVLKHTFGQGKVLKMHKIIFPNNSEGIAVFNGTDHQVIFFDSNGQQIGSPIAFTVCNEANCKGITLTQSGDTILVCTKTSPLYQITITTTNIISIDLYKIEDSKIIKVRNLLPAASVPTVYLTDKAQPTTPAQITEQGIRVGDKYYFGYTAATPNENFPWDVKRYDGTTTRTEYQISTAIITQYNKYFNNITASVDNYSENCEEGDRFEITAGETTLLFEITDMSDPTIKVELVDTTQTTNTDINNESFEAEILNKEDTTINITTYCEVVEYQPNETLTLEEIGLEITLGNLVAVGQQVNIDKTTWFDINHAGEYGVVNDNGTHLKITISTSSRQITELHWANISYTPVDLDVAYITANKISYQYISTSAPHWRKQETTPGSDIESTTQYSVSSVSGIVKVNFTTGFNVNAPSGTNNVKAYVKNLLIGNTFDGGNNGVGTGIITDIPDENITVSSLTATIKGIQVSTIIPFVASDTQYANFKIEVNGYYPAFTGTEANDENNVYKMANFPQNILFYQNRLIIAGTILQPQQLVVSKLGEYNDFSTDYLSTSAFQIVIGSDEKEAIKHILVNQGIQLFCENNEWLLDNATITQNSGFIRNSAVGSSNVKPIISANGVTLFCPKNGKGIIGFQYSYESASYLTPYISLFTNLLNIPITDMFLKKGQDSQDDTLLFICDEEGNLIIGNFLLEHDIQAFCKRSSTSVKYIQTMQIGNSVYFLTKRNGYDSLELLDETKFTTCSAPAGKFSYDRGNRTISFTDNQYNGLPVNVYDENREYVGTYTVQNRSLTITRERLPNAISEVGFNIHSVFTSNPQNVGNSTQDLYKNIATLCLFLTQSSRSDFLKVNGKAGRNKDGFVSYYRVARPQRKCQFTIENDIYPCEILSMEIELEY